MPTLAPAQSSAGTRVRSEDLQIWLNGKLVPRSQATVSVFDHGVLYGDGIFEGIRLYAGKIFEAEAHIRRLYQSAKGIRLTIPMKPEEWSEAIYATAKANGFVDCYVRAVVTRGPGPLGISPTKCSDPVCYIICDMLDLYPRELYERGMAVITCSVTRNNPNALSPRIKSLNYLNNIMGKLEAIDAGVNDAIMLNSEGHVSEATAANIFALRDGVLSTPSLDQGCLEGVTRDVILRLAREMGIETRECVMPRFDLYIADEIFLTGTGAEVMPITQVDKRPVGTGKMGNLTQKLLDAFHKYARGG